jgi:cytochrome c biogenesis protein CcmG, thiol:disulfide interchange protein DsbE
MLTWRAAFVEVWRSAAKHKIATGVVTACIVGSFAAIAWAGTAKTPSTAGKAADPAAPAFSFPVLGDSSQRISLSDYAGKPVIVNFFASWCTPCQGETPLLAKFYRGEHGKVALVGLDENDGLTSALKFTKADGVSYPVGFDPSLVAASAYGVSGLPQTFFLNAQHRIVDRIFGAVTTADLSKGILLATQEPRRLK